MKTRLDRWLAAGGVLLALWLLTYAGSVCFR